MGLLHHVGRKSGKPYRTPLTVFTTDDGIAVLLTYGPDVSARSVGDDEYTRDFLTPLIEDLHTTLIACNRYRYEPTRSR